MPDLSKIKSAVSITDPGEILKRLTQSNENSSRPVEMSETDEGRIEIIKTVPGNAILQAVTATEDDLKAMAVKINLPWEDSYATRVIPFWGSDERVDRHGDIVEQSWDFDSYTKNPLLLNEHDWCQPPIGQVLDWQITDRDEDGYAGKALLLQCLYATADVSPVADSLFRLASANILRTGSVGFYPGELVYIQDEAERSKLGLGEWGCIYRNNELIEFSMATVPANAGAYRLMMAAKSAGKIKKSDIIAMREMKRLQLRRAGKSSADWKRADGEMLLYWSQCFPEVRLEKSTDIDEPLDVLKLFDQLAEKPPTPAPVVDKKEPQQKDDDDSMDMGDVLSAVTDGLTKIHDKMGEHSADVGHLKESMADLHKKMDQCLSTITPADPSDDDEDETTNSVENSFGVFDILLK